MSELKPCQPSIKNAITVLENEKQCVLRQIQIGGCDRNCVKCDLVMKDSEILEGYDTAIAALRRAQPANEPLTLENGFDITNADGMPVDYDALGQKYKDQLCYCDIDQFYIGEDGALVLMDDCGRAVSVDRGDYHIEARPPERSEG
jgi:hypothetical protein